MRKSITYCAALAAVVLTTAGCPNNTSQPQQPDLAPTCDGPTCNGGCAADTDCTADPSTPRCDTGTGVCVACVGDSDCELGKLCNLSNHTCSAGCSAGHGCAAGEGVCDVDSGFCVDCLVDNDCAADPSKPFCDPGTHQCFACSPTNDTCGYGEYCATQSGGGYACVPGCKNDTDCGPPPVNQPDLSMPSDGGIGDASVDGSSSAPDMSTLDMSTSDGGTPAAARCDTSTHQCARCVADSDCPLSKICKAGACVPGCTDTHGCTGGLACCDDGSGSGAKACIDTRSDNLNCGTCGTSCQGGLQCCNSTCVDPSKDNNNCGGCGTVCMAPHGTPVCDRSVCTVPSCTAGWANCNGNPADGCEVQTDTNLANCGGCGNQCSAPQASMQCTAGTCNIVSCNTGFGNCNGITNDGCEVNINNDLNNCGACGKSCPNGGQLNVQNATCISGACGGSCMPGYADCDGNKLSNGCEINTKTDQLNCGGCGMNCDSQCKNMVGANQVASTSCGDGACKVATCKPGWRDINGQCQDGCECSTASAGGDTCTNATSLGTVNIGSQIVQTANLADPDVSARWFKVSFQLNVNNNGYLAHPTVSIDNTTYFTFTVSDGASCATVPLTCAGEGGNSNTPVTSWQTDFQGSWKTGDDAANFKPIPTGNAAGKEPIKATGTATNSIGTVYVKVSKKSGAGVFMNCTDATFTLTIKNKD